MNSPDFRSALHAHFGFSEFRIGQEILVESVYSRKRVLGVMPTGAGKSLCYQLPALMLGGLTVVVSPLISLMKDQVDQLQALGVAATYINSTVPPAERDARIRDACEGRTRLLYLAPERLRPRFMERLGSAEIQLFVVDEAHCISQWGHDFRPDYMRLGEAVKALGVQSVAAFTATATAEVRRDICSQLDIPLEQTYVFGFRRPNLRFEVLPVSRMRQKGLYIERLLRRNPDQAGIVYAATRKTVEKVARELRAAGFSVAHYHGGLDEEERDLAQEKFLRSEVRVMVATNAFGMGIDRSDLRFVIHYEIPGSLEALYQEAGRAGRDGEPAHCSLLFTYADTRIQQFFIDRRDFLEGTPMAVQERLRSLDHQKLRRVVQYAYADRCRHEDILEYFGEPFNEVPCGGCDVCLGEPVEALQAVDDRGSSGRSRARKTRRVEDVGAPRDLSEDEVVVVQKALSAVARADGELTTGVIVQALLGSQAPKVTESLLAGTPSHGILRGWRRELLNGLMEQLQQVGCVAPVPRVRRRLRLTPHGRAVMWRREAVQLAMSAFGSPSAEAPSLSLDSTAQRYYEQLRDARASLARTRGVPAYCVCTDATLRRIATIRPLDRDAMLAIKGVGLVNEASFGESFRAVLGG